MDAPTRPSQSQHQGVSRLSLVLAVVLPLAAGAGAGVAFFRNPAPSGSHEAGAEAPAADHPDEAAGDSPPSGDEQRAKAVAAKEAQRDDAPATEPAVGDADEPAADSEASEQGMLIRRAERGDPAALRALEEKDRAARGLDETIAIAKGRVARRVQELEALKADLSKHPLELDGDEMDPRLIALKGFIEDRDTAVRALQLAATVPSSLGPDILYDTWVGTRGRNETTWLAEQLVYTDAVRGRASDALKVALDLRAAEEDCEATREILPRAAEHGDRRSARLLRRLLSKRGCGKRKLDDCYPCLRPLDRDKDATSVREAFARVRTRRAPRLP